MFRIHHRTRADAMPAAALLAALSRAFMTSLFLIMSLHALPASAGEVTILKSSSGNEPLETAEGTIVLFAPLSTVRTVARDVREGRVDTVRVGEFRFEGCESEGGPLVRGKTAEGRAVVLVGVD